MNMPSTQMTNSSSIQLTLKTLELFGGSIFYPMAGTEKKDNQFLSDMSHGCLSTQLIAVTIESI